MKIAEATAREEKRLVDRETDEFIELMAVRLRPPAEIMREAVGEIEAMRRDGYLDEAQESILLRELAAAALAAQINQATTRMLDDLSGRSRPSLSKPNRKGRA